MNENIPEDLKKYLGSYGEQLFDGWSGEPVCWGYPIVSRAGKENWKRLGQLGELMCSYPNWYLITKKLTREEAIEKYGAITDEEFGPRGGWKSVTFGDKKFSSKFLKEEL